MCISLTVCIHSRILYAAIARGCCGCYNGIGLKLTVTILYVVQCWRVICGRERRRGRVDGREVVVVGISWSCMQMTSARCSPILSVRRLGVGSD